MELLDWLKANDGLFALLGLFGLGLFLISLLVFPLIIIFLPHDYFVRPQTAFATLNPFRMLLRVLKNAFGCVLIVAGVLMLFLPGQGLLSLLLGVSLVQFPGKRRFELRLLRLQGIRKSVAWVRQKANRRPVILPAE
jgi:hypothetical protein